MKSKAFSKIAVVPLTLFILWPLESNAITLESYIARYNPAEAPAIASAIRYSAHRHGLDPLLFASVLYVESRYDNTAVSSAGALGISQLMPNTAAELGADPYDLHENIDGGAQYLADMIRYTRRTDAGLAAYNAGPGAVKDGIPSYTLGYIADVTDAYRNLQRMIDEEDAPPLPTKPKLTRKQRLLRAIRKIQKTPPAKNEPKEKEKRSYIFF